VRNFREAVNYYTKKLGFDLLWDWGKPPAFGCVRLDRVEIFFCLQDQGHPGTWLSLFIDDVDDYYQRIRKAGAKILHGPEDKPWGCREVHVQDPNQHVLRFSQGIPMREPKLMIKRVPLKARLEKRLSGLLQDLARHKNMTVGEVLEETLLHTFERVKGGGVASPHTKKTLDEIQVLKKKHRINYDVHASYRFVEQRGGRKTRGQKDRPK
jgi:catechol 2,3-dioxygenase-like lactoylglutathione lyase family enzyme